MSYAQLTTWLVLADVPHRLSVGRQSLCRELRAAGADFVLPKEFSPEEFLNVVAGSATAA